MAVRAVAWSVVVHAALVALGLVWVGAAPRPATSAASAPVGAAAATVAAAVDAPKQALEPPTTVVELRSAGDALISVARPSAPTTAPNPDPQAGAAAASAGHGAGAPTLVTDRADAVTLRVQPYDAARGYQMQRIRTATERESREQVRATPHPEPTPWLSSRGGRGHARDQRHARAVASTARTSDENDRAPPVRAAESATGTARPDLARNPASTDAARPSEAVADRVDQALVSDDKTPQKLELSKPTSPGAGISGRGDGALGYAPDGVGAAPVPTGAPALPDARSLQLATYQRVYDRYLSRVKQKVDPLWEFPRELAVRMEQGDVIVAFTIRGNGNVKDVRVIKGSGFPSFDKNVLAAIKKAAPFEALPATLGPELRVMAPFEGSNPAIR